jgi:hypothetical protein
MIFCLKLNAYYPATENDTKDSNGTQYRSSPNSLLIDLTGFQKTERGRTLNPIVQPALGQPNIPT